MNSYGMFLYRIWLMRVLIIRFVASTLAIHFIWF